MKFFKKLATLVMALTLCVGVGATIGACGGDKDNSSTVEQTKTTCKFKVLLADKTTPAVGYKVQLCLTNGTCITGVPVAEDGTCDYPITKGTEYTVHIWNLDDTQEITDFTGLKTIPANYDGSEVVLVFKN